MHVIRLTCCFGSIRECAVKGKRSSVTVILKQFIRLSCLRKARKFFMSFLILIIIVLNKNLIRDYKAWLYGHALFADNLIQYQFRVHHKLMKRIVFCIKRNRIFIIMEAFCLSGQIPMVIFLVKKKLTA